VKILVMGLRLLLLHVMKMCVIVWACMDPATVAVDTFMNITLLLLLLLLAAVAFGGQAYSVPIAQCNDFYLMATLRGPSLACPLCCRACPSSCCP